MTMSPSKKVAIDAKAADFIIQWKMLAAAFVMLLELMCDQALILSLLWRKAQYIWGILSTHPSKGTTSSPLSWIRRSRVFIFSSRQRHDAKADCSPAIMPPRLQQHLCCSQRANAAWTNSILRGVMIQGSVPRHYSVIPSCYCSGVSFPSYLSCAFFISPVNFSLSFFLQTNFLAVH